MWRGAIFYLPIFEIFQPNTHWVPPPEETPDCSTIALRPKKTGQGTILISMQISIESAMIDLHVECSSAG
jgi:hypothetical protein